MSVIAAALKHMLAAGMPHDAIVHAVAEMEASAAPQKTARQLRNARYYAAKSSEKRLKASEQDVSDDSVLKPSRAHVEDKTLTTVIEPQVKKVRACRLPTDFSPDLVWAQGQGLSPSQAQTEAAKFRDYWSSKGSNATKTDWPATWRNWVRQSVERLPRGSPFQRPPTAADLAADLLRQMEQPDASTASEIEGHSTSLVRFPRVASG